MPQSYIASRTGRSCRPSGRISVHTLINRLRLFEQRGIVTRTAFAEIPPREIYELTRQRIP
ncbi:winged helix-turn-helix transcriptional regulator [Rhodococcus erythropolis]|uniref:winged helix-turn-helix transcriptional regulator n=1 Tax=Rhodococcus erythropolis TaxID=1833 RepID=UPI00210ECE86|nr:winged helix-turn-helix transcriptional regulator [Rhodococcus erythropolis]